ncbi:SDR family oxidoreductase [Leptospira gomenensis]|uniref:SDR family oxidoreductase n=1 Tax=Leptospira gomenensis TaxID=2484974 RepID=A0A5F1YS22_9LEPT|nr:SDR family oxidoreductase [Leptospira gomenensis]TGK36028.1 SDR family oxidoreductase [Leptospira gomenensis]TGK44440.1 SDR family oxidoreductase [Leptospira gomenensis]TGK53369.1 SDR family oxidoreductase [Leptospira gomenensis]TGK60697.1 SDR family oxidoreductase [Leptospira gomenensis]
MKYQLALITGASGGLGNEFCNQLAAAGSDLIVTDLSSSSLKKLRTELETNYKIAVHTIEADLSISEGRDKILSYVTKNRLTPDLLVNNAGLGYIGDFVNEPESSFLTMIRVNVEALTEMTRKILPIMIANGKGRILNLASTASFQPVPYFTVYAASKVFVLYFTDGLSFELKGTGVSVHAVSPGPIRTPFFGKAFPKGFRSPDLFWLTPTKVVTTALAGMERGKTVIVVGWVNHIQKILTSILPRRSAAWIGSIVFSVGKSR